MKHIILIFFGSGTGGVLRYMMSKWISQIFLFNFPLATLIINFIACFIIGFVMIIAEQKQIISQHTKLFLIVGFCSRFSTFSAFSMESITLIQQQQQYITFFLYIMLSIILCLASTYLGIQLSQQF